MQCKRLRITGVVQGVGYRAWAKRLADMLNVKGYVRNMDDGSVEMVVCADEEKTITVMINAAKKGPAASVVKNVKVFDTDFEPNERFEIWM